MVDIFQSLWIGKSLSKMEQLSIKSFIDYGNMYHLYSYEEVLNVPEGTIVKDANEILPEKDIFTYKNGSFSAFSNYFRFQLLHQKGGYWVDTDFICLKKIELDQPYVIASQVGPNYKEKVTSFFLKLPQNSKIAKRGIEIQKEHKKLILSGEMEWGSGPLTIKQLIKEFELERYVMSWDHFSTCWCQDARSLVEPNFLSSLPVIKQIEQLPKKMVGIHLWNEIWCRNKIDKNISYHPDSIYEKLKAKHQI
jgi:hypothetical protein